MTTFTSPAHSPATIDRPLAAELRGVSREYRRGPTVVRALDGVDLSIQQGEFVVFLGPSGSGKTTLLNIVGGIETPTRGEVVVNGQRVHELGRKALTRYRRENIGFVFQFFNLIPSLSAWENVELAARLVPEPLATEDVLRRVGLGERMDHFPSELSGGEQQRVAIARAVVRQPPILLCDEPTGELDLGTGRAVLALLKEINEREGTTILLVTHNSVISHIADRTVHMHSGKIAEIEDNAGPVDPTTLRW